MPDQRPGRTAALGELAIVFGRDAVNVSAVGLMAAVTVKLGHEVLAHWPAWIIVAGAAPVVLRWKVNPAWLVLGGALLGWLPAPWANAWR